MALLQTRGRGEDRIPSLVGAFVLAAHLEIRSEAPPAEDPEAEEDPEEDEPEEDDDDG